MSYFVIYGITYINGILIFLQHNIHMFTLIRIIKTYKPSYQIRPHFAAQWVLALGPQSILEFGISDEEMSTQSTHCVTEKILSSGHHYPIGQRLRESIAFLWTRGMGPRAWSLGMLVVILETRSLGLRQWFPTLSPLRITWGAFKNSNVQATHQSN